MCNTLSSQQLTFLTVTETDLVSSSIFPPLFPFRPRLYSWRSLATHTLLFALPPAASLLFVIPWWKAHTEPHVNSLMLPTWLFLSVELRRPAPPHPHFKDLGRSLVEFLLERRWIRWMLCLCSVAVGNKNIITTTTNNNSNRTSYYYYYAIIVIVIILMQLTWK